jgi:hypothetical protein
MLHGIQMDVITVSEVIFFVTNAVFPVARLPHAAPPLVPVLVGHIPVPATGGKIVVRESTLDLPPALREIIVVRRECPHTVQVIGQ